MTSTVSLPLATSKKQIWQTDISWFIFPQQRHQHHVAPRRNALGVGAAGVDRIRSRGYT